MLPPVDGEHHNLVISGAEIDRVRESRQQRATGLGVDPPEQQGVSDDPGDERVESLAKLSSQAYATGFIPRMHSDGVVFGLRPEDNFARHGLPQQLGPNVGPRHR